MKRIIIGAAALVALCACRPLPYIPTAPDRPPTTIPDRPEPETTVPDRETRPDTTVVTRVDDAPSASVDPTRQD